MNIIQKLKPTQSTDRNAKGPCDIRASTYESSWEPRFAKELMNHVSDPPLSLGNRCLDLCCGTGLVTFLVAQQVVPGGRVYGIDISEGMLHVAKAKQFSADQSIRRPPKADQGDLKDLTEEERDCVRLINHDVEDLSGLSELDGLQQTFDLVSCASGLVLLKIPREAIKSWAQWLKPGEGRMILDVPHPRCLRSSVALEAAALHIGLEVPFNRSWVKNYSSLREVLERVEILTVDKIILVEQTGAGTQYWPSSQETAEEKFKELMEGSTLVVWADALEQSIKDKLKEVFCDERSRSANDDGLVEELDCAWIAVATRKKAETP